MAKGNYTDEDIRSKWRKVTLQKPVVVEVNKVEKRCPVVYMRTPKYRDILNVLNDQRIDPIQQYNDPMFPAIILPLISVLEDEGGEIVDWNSEHFLDLELPQVTVLTDAFGRLNLGEQRYEEALARGEMAAGELGTVGVPRRRRKARADDVENPPA